MSTDRNNLTDQNPITNTALNFFRGCGKVLNEVGIIGFLVLFIAFLILYISTPGQKLEIIDEWILLKDNNLPPTIIIIFLFGLLVMQQIHYKRTIKQKDERINELANNKNSDYKNKLKVKLSSSKKERK